MVKLLVDGMATSCILSASVGVGLAWAFGTGVVPVCHYLCRDIVMQ
jgi:hypothetical protein